MMNHMETLPGKDWTDERTLKDLLERADRECEKRSHTPSTPAPKPRTKPRFNDEAQEWIQARVNAAFERYTRQPIGIDSVGRGRGQRLENISDADFVRLLTEPQQLDLDETPDTHRKLEDLSDESFIEALTRPTMMNID